MSGARRAGCAPKRRPILELGNRKRFLAAAGGCDALRDIVRDYVMETLGAEDAVLVTDETAFRGRSRRSGPFPTADYPISAEFLHGANRRPWL